MTWIISTQYGTGLAKNLRDVVFKRRYQDGHQLADRIWNLAAISEREILGRVNAAISQGVSAVELSRSVRDFLLKPGPAWTTGIKPSVTGRGSLAYNALRLARTEINQGYRQAHKLQAMNSPLVVGIKWNLSASHPTSWPDSAEYMGYPEICDYRANHDHSGLGPGVFPKDNVPDDHPNGMCFNTDLLAPPEQLEELLMAHNEIETGLISKEKLDVLQKDAALAINSKTVYNKSISTQTPLFPEQIAGVQRGEPMTRRKANGGRPNPNYSKGGGYKVNCQSCVVSYEARLRGYDVETLPNTPGSKLAELMKQTNLAWIDPATGEAPSYMFDDSIDKAKDMLGFIEKTVEKGGRYTFEFAWNSRSLQGHIISMDRDSKGSLRLYDPQTGQTIMGSNITKYLEKIRYSLTIDGNRIPMAPKILRVDDKLFNHDMVDHIMKGVD